MTASYFKQRMIKAKQEYQKILVKNLQEKLQDVIIFNGQKRLP